MAPTHRSAIHIPAGLTATVVVQHVVVASVVDLAASSLHLPALVRIGLTTLCLVSHWHLHVRRH